VGQNSGLGVQAGAVEAQLVEETRAALAERVEVVVPDSPDLVVAAAEIMRTAAVSGAGVAERMGIAGRSAVEDAPKRPGITGETVLAGERRHQARHPATHLRKALTMRAALGLQRLWHQRAALARLVQSKITGRKIIRVKLR